MISQLFNRILSNSSTYVDHYISKWGCLDTVYLLPYLLPTIHSSLLVYSVVVFLYFSISQPPLFWVYYTDTVLFSLSLSLFLMYTHTCTPLLCFIAVLAEVSRVFPQISSGEVWRDWLLWVLLI